MCAKHYENPTMLSKVTAKNVGNVFLRHTVYIKVRSGDVWHVSNGRNVDHVTLQAVCRPFSIAATCCYFRSSLFRLVGNQVSYMF